MNGNVSTGVYCPVHLLVRKHRNRESWKVLKTWLYNPEDLNEKYSSSLILSILRTIDDDENRHEWANGQDVNFVRDVDRGSSVSIKTQGLPALK